MSPLWSCLSMCCENGAPRNKHPARCEAPPVTAGYPRLPSTQTLGAAPAAVSPADAIEQRVRGLAFAPRWPLAYEPVGRRDLTPPTRWFWPEPAARSVRSFPAAGLARVHQPPSPLAFSASQARGRRSRLLTAAIRGRTAGHDVLGAQDDSVRCHRCAH